MGVDHERKDARLELKKLDIEVAWARTPWNIDIPFPETQQSHAYDSCYSGLLES